MGNVTVVGSQWGDEGKGKIVDWLCERADVVVRFQGGHNAGHTLVVGGETYKLSLLPSGVVRSHTLSVIGNGVVVDPWALLEEIDSLRSRGIEISPQTLCVAENASLILPVHRDLDVLREQSGGGLGTTRRGIGPAYEDKVGRRALRVGDLRDKEVLSRKIERLLVHHNALRRGLGQEEVGVSVLQEALEEIALRLLPYVGQSWALLSRVRREGKRVLFEGAQGTLLDVDHGTYPFVTSSNTVAAQAAIGSGVGVGVVGTVLGITKAYTTRVGAGPFPTEQDNEQGRSLGERGLEFGTVTGRKRRCGWFDAVLVRQSVMVGGINGVALTKLDVLDGFEEVRLCTSYGLGGEKIDFLPSGEEAWGVEAHYETMEGWQESTRGARSWRELPANAIKYVRRIEELVGAPVMLLSTSPERDDVILVRDPFQD